MSPQSGQAIAGCRSARAGAAVAAWVADAPRANVRSYVAQRSRPGMARRTRLVITARTVCHLVVACLLLTSEARPQTSLAFAVPRFSAQAQAAPPPTTTRAGEAIITAQHWQKTGDIYTLRGDADIKLRDMELHADEIIYNDATGEATITGNMELSGGPHHEHITASHGSYNTQSETGRFYDVIGSTGMRFHGRQMVLTSSNPFVFQGKFVEKTSPNRYIVHDGSITVCDSPRPAWSLGAQRVIVDAGENAQVYHATFRLGGIPLLYLPYVARPIATIGRQTGFLLPTVGISSRKGTTLGDSFYWAINRSADATLGAEYFSRRGWAQHGDFRARPSDDSYIEANYFGVLDRGLETTVTSPAGVPTSSRVDQGGQEFTLSSEGLFQGVRAVADIDYLSDFVFRLAFNENFTQAVNSEVKSAVFASSTWRGFALNGFASRYQNFESTAHGDFVNIWHAPSFESSRVEQPLWRTPFVWSYEAAAEGVSRREPGFATSPIVGRFDLTPLVALPLVLAGWSIRPEVALRETYYTQRVVPNGSLGVPVSVDVNRRAVEGSLELRPPALARIFERKFFGRTLKHTIEPRAVYRYVNGVDNFQNIIRFDARDILSDTNEVEYGVVNRLYAKRSSAAADCAENILPETTDWRTTRAAPPARITSDDMSEPLLSSGCDKAGSVREIVTWEIAQKGFFNQDFGGAVVNGRRNVLSTTADFTGIAFLTEPRNLSPIISRLRIHTSQNTDVQWNYDYDSRKGRVNSSTAIVTWRMGEVFVGGSHAFLHVPGEIFTGSANPVPGPDRFNQFRVLAGFGHPNKRGINFAGNLGADANFNFLQYATAQTSYNWDCLGVAVEYRRLALGPVRNENQFRFSLSLANIGSFGNLRRQERLF